MDHPTKSTSTKKSEPHANVEPVHAADLSALVHDEIDAKEARVAAERAAQAVPGDMPALSGEPAWQPPPMTVTFWQKLAPKSRRGPRSIHLILGLVVASALAGGVVIGAKVLRREPAPPVVANAPVASGAPSGPAAPPAPGPGAASPPAAAPPTAASAPIPNPPVHTKAVAAAAPAPKATAAKGSARRNDEREAEAATETNEPDTAEAPAAPAEAAPAGGRALTAADIKAGVKQGMAAVMGCIKTARAVGELAPGTHTLILEWTIAPAGTVTEARVRGPAAVLSTALPACFSQGMRQWRFPASSAGAPVKNFPFGPFTLK